jgi:hypothetical protein
MFFTSGILFWRLGRRAFYTKASSGGAMDCFEMLGTGRKAVIFDVE